ncbi:FHA domain-containing protein DDL [Sesamum indicum]|uniref:FHA domain-containing protein DDL n=1 Tax=Sesamum indicum TaxID=4182 RepID=A0A6I9UH42_SESIN|nr:FHA domain-containing protein DDL [Sesamum indicum]XP_011097908.1 FHA domain-containing protein DDL [Sesamum indicum]XP_011097910.1 FHA domain-containing protein DDL [Sesamum indicum]
MGRRNSESPVRDRGSPRRRTPSRRERSPARHRSSNSDKLSSRNRSPRRPRSRSPHSPVREKLSSRTKSPKHRRSLSPVSRSPVRQKPSKPIRSPKRVKSRSPPPLSPEKGKLSGRTRSPRSARSRSPESRSPSPRSKRLKRAKTERERDAEKSGGREHEKNHGRKADRGTNEEKDLDRDLPIEKKDRRPGRDAVGDGSRSRHGHSPSPPDRHHRGQRRSRSPYTADNRGHDELTNSRDTEQRNSDSDSIAKMKAAEEKLEAKEKQKPSFELSGKLAAETNRVRGVTLLFNEPPDARKPDVRWRLYVFKGGEVLNEPLYIHRQTCYLFGRERRVADIPTDHPSCSKQHAVLQYRQVEEENPDGTMSKRVRPYLMDLGSTNGTFINDNQLEPQRYYELFEKDTIKFGNSSREYVLLHENSTD